jgi:hypothetical protein
MEDPTQHPIDIQNFQTLHKKRKGFWYKIGGGALTFALLFHLIILVIGAAWIFQVIYEPEKKVDFLPGGGSAGGGERSAQTKVQQKKQRQITPTTNVKRVFAEGATSTYAIPDPGDNFGEMSTLSSLGGGGMSGGLGGSGSGGGFGSGQGTGTGLGMGSGSGKLFGLIPETMRKRCSKEDRLQRLKENGGTPACEEAVTKGLHWLKATQNPDGSWGTRAPAMTGLALLSYFGHCETPTSEEFGDSCMKGIVYLVNVGIKNKGRIASNFTENGWCYEHAIATYALGEALVFCKQLKVNVPYLEEVTTMAGQFIIDNQNENGGWAYMYATEGGHTDSSVVGWQLQALKACSHSKIQFKGMNSAVTKGLKYMNDLQNNEGGFGYATPTQTHAEGYYSLTGVGVLCNQMWGRSNRSEVRKGAKYIIENTKFEYNTEFCDLYAHYYESQAMMQRGGEDWKKYNDIFRDQLLQNQDEDGSWKTPGGGNKPRAAGALFVGDKTYRTTLCILMLESYYRFLATSGGEKTRSGI